MAKPSFFKFFGREANLDKFWGALEEKGLADSSLGARFFQLFTVRAETTVAAGESAQSAVIANPRIGVIRAPEWAAIAIPASGGSDASVESQPLIDLGTAASAAAVPGPVGEELPNNEAVRTAVIQYVAAPNLSAGASIATASNVVVALSEELTAVSIFDARTMTIMQGGPGDYPELGTGPDDVLEIAGDYSSGFTLSPMIPGVDTIVLRAGDDYNFSASDDLVAPGATLSISAMPLGEGDHMLFDGSAETDGRFILYGSEGSDVFLGGAGDDRIYGLGGADLLNGGGGSDSFAYTFASESSGAAFDMIGDFDPGVDRIDLRTPVTSFGAAIEGGTLSMASFDDDLGAVMGGLAANQAVWFAPDAGDLAGTIFLIVDANGVAGYQQGEDYVFAIGGAPLADLTGHTGFFV